MNGDLDLLDIVQTALGTFEHRQSFSPGMFEPLKPLFEKLGYEAAAVYIADDYPDRMCRISGYGGEDVFPESVLKNGRKTLSEELSASLSGIRGVMIERLFNHDRELGALAVVTRNPGGRETKEAFSVLAKTLSIMAYVERIRTNARREREERDLFFAQSLTNRLIIRNAPKVKGLRLGFSFSRSLEAGGDFFNFIPTRDGGLLGVVGCCSGKGLRTVLEVCQITGTIHHGIHKCASLSEVLQRVNTFLVREKSRAHQASLCLYRIDTKARKIHLAKAGRLGILLCGPGNAITNISSSGGSFLGMVANPGLSDETYDFAPGQSLFCVTEGFYSSRNCMNARPQLHWFLQAVEATLEMKRKAPLANAILDNLDAAGDYATRPSDSMLALSVEFTGK